jgi:hypothetical protein
MPLQATSGAASYDAFGGGAAAEPIYIEDVFSTYLYTGNGSTQTITNGIDLAGEGGLVWIKARTANDGFSRNHALYDTTRGPGSSTTNNKTLSTNLTAAEGLGSTYGYLSAFSSSGFTVVNGAPSDSRNITNQLNENFVSWAFREQEKFFDVVTWTGSGANRTIAHNLGSVPGCIIVKETSSSGIWAMYHRSLGATQYLRIETNSPAQTSSFYWNNTSPTSTFFSLGTDTDVNQSGETYVAYLFAHDAGGFGLTGTDNVISCGSYTGNGSATGPVIDLGYEPQWVMIKSASISNPWYIGDEMRGFTAGVAEGGFATVQPNANAAEVAGTQIVAKTSTGFRLCNSGTGVNGSGSTYIYIAIRRGPMKVPTTGTEVFSPNAVTAAVNASVTTNFPVDMVYGLVRPGGDRNIVDRLRGISNTSANSPYLKTESTSAELSNNIIYNADNQTGYKFGSYVGGASLIMYSYRRAPGFFDEVCYTGTGANRTVAHNLAAVPELMIVKGRSTLSVNSNWCVYCSHVIGAANTGYLYLNSPDSYTDNTTFWSTAPTSSVFSLSSNNTVNENTDTFVAYLFASCPGVSKVGNYTGTGATQVINCGFAGGARFVLIKRTDSTGDWYVWDSARGIVAGDDPYLLLNSRAAEVTNTDYIDTAATGFDISSTAPAAINASGGSFIFLAVA